MKTKNKPQTIERAISARTTPQVVNRERSRSCEGMVPDKGLGLKLVSFRF